MAVKILRKTPQGYVVREPSGDVRTMSWDEVWSDLQSTGGTAVVLIKEPKMNPLPLPAVGVIDITARKDGGR